MRSQLHDVSRSSSLSFAGLLVLTLLATGPALAGEHIVHERQADALILRYEFRPGELVPSGSLSLELWGDGRVVVSRPSWARKSGQYEVMLNQVEVQSFLTQVTSPALVEFVAADVRAAKLAQEEARLRAAREAGEPQVLHYTSDGETTELQLSLLAYGADESDAGPVDLSLSWYGLGHDKRIHAELPAIAALSDADAAVRVLLSREDLGG